MQLSLGENEQEMTEEAQGKIPRPLKKRIDEAPSATVFLLLHVNGTGPGQEAAIERAGFTVRHRTTIVPCIAVSGPGQGLRSLLKESWLVRVEEDAAVQTW